MNNLSISQNFLKDSNLVKKLLDETNINKEDTVLEIGPGKGIITIKLTNICKKVIGIEYDKLLFDYLINININNLNIIYGNFLDYEFKEKVKIFSNIPFNITSDIFNKILENVDYIETFYFIMQKEAAEMYLGTYNETLKSLLFKPFYENKIIYNFNKTDFDPSPSVDTVLVEFNKKEFFDIKKAKIIDYFDFIAHIFDNNETTIEKKVKDILTYEQLKRIKKLLKTEVTDKITNIKYEDIITLFNTFRDYVPDSKKIVVKDSYDKLKKKQESLEKINRTRSK